MTTTPTILFIGCGNMNASIIGGALSVMPDARIVALDPDVKRAKSMVTDDNRVEFVSAAAELAEIAADLVVLGVKPQVFPSLDAETLALMSGCLTISVMAGVPSQVLMDRLGHNRVVRVMPNLPVFIGQGMSLGQCTEGAVTTDEKQIVARLFASLGAFDWAEDEDAFERANPVFSCGPGFFFCYAHQMVQAAIGMGLPEAMADRLVRQTLLGSAMMLAQDSRDARTLKEAVTSPNGTTQAGLGVLENGLETLVPATLNAAYRRALELAQEA